MHRKNFNFICTLLIGFFLIASCSKEERQSKMAGVLEFNIPSLARTFVINQFNRSVYNPDSVHFTTDLTALKATFSLPPGATLKVGEVVQESGVTANDFTKPVIYTVVAQDGKTVQQYTVTIILTLDPKAVAWRRLSAEGFGAFQDASTAVFLGRVYTAAFTLNSGTPNTWGIYFTGDGNAWTRVKAADDKRDSIPLAAHGRLVTFRDKLWLLGGLRKDAVLNTIWSTTDGQAWTRSDAAASRWSPRERLNAVVAGDALWVIGGNEYPANGNPAVSGKALNDVWSSADGLVWARRTEAAAFPARSNPAVFLYKNRIYIAGGTDNNKQYLNDIWYTENGVEWKQVATVTPPPAREGYKILVNKSQLLLIGGTNGANTYGDLWVSEDDGVNWKQITDPKDSRSLPADFPKRAYYDAFTSGRTIWVLGGLDNTTPVKEIWLGSMN